MGMQKRIEELLLIILISMNILEMLNLLPGVAGFFKAIMSFTAIGYVLYKISLSDFFFGEKDTRLDFLLIMGYFSLIISKLIQFCMATYHESEILQDFFDVLINNTMSMDNGMPGIEKIGLIVGFSVLILISIYVTFRVKFKEPSILSTLHINKGKFIITLMIIFGFFIIFFNPVMEWFTLVIDTPLVIIVLFVYIFKIHDIGKNMDEEEMLFKISDAAETFVENFIALFHSKKTFLLGISALLVLYPIADIGGYIIPYTFSSGSIYTEEASIGRLFDADKIIVTEPSQQVILLFSYILNVIGMILLLAFPAVIWYMIYTNQVGKFSPLFIAAYSACLVFLSLSPVFSIGRFDFEDNIIGVKIFAESIGDLPFVTYIIITLLVFVAVFILSNIKAIYFMLNYIITMIGLGYFGAYIYNYLLSTLNYYISLISQLYQSQMIDNLFLIPFNALFICILVVFYIAGYISFAYEIFE